MKRKAIIVFAPGFEEIEAVTPADILRRAEVRVELVGLETEEVEGAHGIAFRMDRTLGESEDADAIVLPGGLPGAEHLANSKRLVRILKQQLAAGRIVAAICASPGLVLGKHGIADGRRATCYPGFEKHFGSSTTTVDDAVVKDGNLMTSRGPGTAFAFGLALARELAGEETLARLSTAMLYSR